MYEVSAKEYVVFDLRDSVLVYRGEKPVHLERKTASGVIESSLYVTMTENGMNPELSMQLSDLYAWSIDFYRIQKGDKFKVIYEEEFVEDQSIGIKNIVAAYFEHADNPYYAFQYDQEEIEDNKEAI